MDNQQAILKVYQSGELTVVGFGGVEVLSQLDLVSCRDEIRVLVQNSKCKTLAFDLTGVKLIPSGLLGLLASIRDLGTEVQLYNPSADVREVLEVTKLDRVMPIHEVDL